jgi:hypothetical protein
VDEAILVAEVDLEQIVRGKYDLDVIGHYARPDIFQLIVDERPKRAVTLQTAGSADATQPCEAAKASVPIVLLIEKTGLLRPIP